MNPGTRISLFPFKFFAKKMERMRNARRNLRLMKPKGDMKSSEPFTRGNVAPQTTDTRKREMMAVAFCISAHLFAILEYSTGIINI